MWRQNDLCDVSIICEGIRIRAHKVVLATCSDYFHAVLTSTYDSDHTAQGLDGFEIPLEGLEVNTIQTLLECMYTGRLTLSDSNVKDLLIGASRLRMFAIEKACGQFLQNRLNKHNCIRLLNLAATYNLDKMKEEALKLASEYFIDISQGHDFYDLELELVTLLLSRDDLRAEELDIFRRTLAWLEHDKTARMRYIGELLGHVRLPLISPVAIVDQVESVDYLEGNPECEMLVKEALHYHCLPARQSLLQTPRTCPRAHQIRDCVLAIGGAPRLKNDPVSKDILAYDPMEGQWNPITQLKEPRHHHAVAELGGFLYVAGGEETNDQRSPLNTAFRYDPRTKVWLQIGSMIQARESFQMGVLNSRLYAVGGRVDQDISLAEVERYNPAVDKWESVAPISAARRSIAVASHNGRLYAMGGSGHKRISSKVERFNPLTNSWETRRPLSVPRFFALLSSVGSRLFLVGGATIDKQGNVICVRKTECYVPATDTWVSLSCMNEPRAEAGCAVIGSHIYVVGGYSWDRNKRLSSVEKYDTKRDSWTEVEDFGASYTGVGACTLRVYDFYEDTLTEDAAELQRARGESDTSIHHEEDENEANELNCGDINAQCSIMDNVEVRAPNH